MRPLNDITIYPSITLLISQQERSDLNFASNFIADYYHNSLDGYKPVKTAKISIWVDNQSPTNDYHFAGAVCLIHATMNVDQYRRLNKYERYSYLLKLMHKAILRTSKQLGWDLQVFDKAYERVKNSNYLFARNYGRKTSRDRKKTVDIILEKSELETVLKLAIQSDGNEKTVDLFSKKNWYWYDSVYKIIKQCKWIDTDRFGYQPKNSKHFVYYSLSKGEVISNLTYHELQHV